MMTCVTAIRHTGIVVNDMEKMVSFYRDVLGLKEVKSFTEEGNYIDSVLDLTGVKLWMIKLVAADHSMIELLKYQSPLPNSLNKRTLNDSGCSHIAFTCNNLDGVYRQLRKAGVQFTCAPQVSSDGYAKVTFCQDPEGNFLELVEVLSEDML